MFSDNSGTAAKLLGNVQLINQEEICAIEGGQEEEMSDCMRCGGDVSEIWIITQILIEIIECKKR